ncbi:hypothetical protein [Nonomuraea sp. NPDC049480]|uniref:hypothetical protein n=1 Tax=Nonomuraea sp. NPDC049480 TaxID=3364353 RepID=UPI0037BB8B51
MAAPEPPTDAIAAARTWLEELAESFAHGEAAEPAPAQVRGVRVGLARPQKRMCRSG